MDMRFLRVMQSLFLLLLHTSQVVAENREFVNTSIICKERERQALLALKKDFTDPHDELSSWASGDNHTECCEWEGVTCNDLTGHVVELDIHNRSLGGIINPSLVELHHLIYLDLSSNDFNGSHVPKFIDSLTHLKYLNLSFLHFNGKIPHELGNLFHLEHLDLRNNFLDGEFPTHLYNLSRLVHLDLSGNSFDGEFPTHFCNLSKLVHLDLSYNLFTGEVPSNLGNLTSLLFLSLGGGDYPNVPIKSLRSDLEWVSHLKYLKTLLLNSIDLSIAYNWLKQVSNLAHLKELELRRSYLQDNVPSSFSSINITRTNLAYVDLSFNNLTSSICKSFLDICSLRELHLSHNELRGRLDEFIPTSSHCANKSLELLDLSSNEFTGSMPNLSEFPSLSVIRLAHNSLNGTVSESIWDICSLRELHLSDNELRGRLDEFIPTSSHCANKSLELLDLSSNEFTGSMPNLSEFPSLRVIRLAYNSLNGTVSESIWELSKLEVFSVSDNSLQGVISEVHFSKLSKLILLDLSFNALMVNVSSDWVPPFQIELLYLASCKLSPHFPRWLRTQKSISLLDISSNAITDPIPNWFPDLYPNLQVLNLSNNHISGEIANLPLQYNYFGIIALNSNKLQGQIPSTLSTACWMDLSNNMFSEANLLICSNQTKRLTFLDLSNNQLTGKLPECWTHFEELVFLNLANNSLSGNIPSSMGFLTQIEALHLGNNNFMGEIPLSLNNCRQLRIFDAVKNNLSGSVASWIGDGLQKLQILSIRSNMFNGSLPSNICHLPNLQLLDLSFNNISGSIPKCLQELTSLARRSNSNTTITYYYDAFYDANSGWILEYTDSASLIWKRKETKYKKTLGLLRSIDLSSNSFVGKIPDELMNLTELVSLNISRNKLSGEIPPTIGQLKSLDSLDLSRNQLSGRIPSQFSQLGFLGVLDLSYNNLSGEIPFITKLQSFDGPAYMGNPELCGAPLSKCPMEQTHQHDVNDEDGKHNFNLGLYISVILGFIVGFWGVCGSLVLKKSWRYAYFKFFDDLYEMIIAMSRRFR